MKPPCSRTLPKGKLMVYRRGDELVVTKLKVPSFGDELKELFKKIDEQYEGKRRPTEREILDEIQAYRRERRATPSRNPR